MRWTVTLHIAHPSTTYITSSLSGGWSETKYAGIFLTRPLCISALSGSRISSLESNNDEGYEHNSYWNNSVSSILLIPAAIRRWYSYWGLNLYWGTDFPDPAIEVRMVPPMVLALSTLSDLSPTIPYERLWSFLLFCVNGFLSYTSINR